MVELMKPRKKYVKTVMQLYNISQKIIDKT